MNIEDKLEKLLVEGKDKEEVLSIIEELRTELSSYREELIFQNKELKNKNLAIERTNYELREINECVKKERKSYEDYFLNAPIPYVIIDLSSKILKKNFIFSKLISGGEVKKITEIIAEESQDRFHFFKRDLKKSKKPIEVELEVRIANRMLNCKFYGTKLNDNEFRLLILDETKIKEKQKKIEYISYHDDLTNLKNRRYFRENLDILERNRIDSIGIILIDLNGLKIINDSFGHDVGDLLLIETAKILIETSKKNYVVARLGGDEFAVVIPKTSEVEVTEFIKEIKEKAKNLKFKEIGFNFSIGYSIKKESSETVSKVFKDADDNLYKNKILVENSRKIIYEMLHVLHESYPVEMEHSKRVSKFLGEFASALELPKKKVEELELAGLFHDIGKISIHTDILGKNGSLDEFEKKEVERHPELSFRILNKSARFSKIATYSLYHHERVDGGGYPFGLSGEKIPKESKMISIVDTYDAIISDRSYRKAKPKEKAIEILREISGTQLDKELTEFFIEKVVNKK